MFVSSSETDVLIIGAGVIGCTIAFELAAAGCRVRVIDQRAPSMGASWASAGVLAPYVEGHDSALLRTLGQRSLDAYPAFVARVEAASGRPVAFARSGTLEVATSTADVARLTGSMSVAHREGVNAQWLDGAALSAAEPALAGHALGALAVPGHAAVDVPALTQAAAAAAAALGAVFDPPTPVREIRDAGEAVAVETTTGTLHAAQVVLAAGAWSAALAPATVDRPPLHPVRGQLLYLRAAPGTLRHVVWAPDIYLVPWADGRVFVGATSEHAGFDERATAGGVAGLLARAIALVPALAGASFLEARHGLRPGSPDELPLVGRSTVMPRLIYACGHYRNGALLAPLTAALVAGLVHGDAADDALTALTPARAGRL